MSPTLCLPGFLSDGDLRAATSRLNAVECRELWRRQRPLVERYGQGLHLAIDALLERGVPDSAKVRHWCYVSKEVLRANAHGRDPEPSSLSHLIVDSLAPERSFLLHTLRLVESLLAGALDGALDGAPLELALGVAASPGWDFGRSGALLAEGIGRTVTVRLDAAGLTLDEGGPLIDHALPGGRRLRVDARYRYAPPVALSGEPPLLLPIFERGLREPYTASAPVVRDPAVARSWLPLLERSSALVRAADPTLLEESLRYAPEALPVYHGLGQSFASASNEDVLGYVYLPAISTPLDVAECLVHEAMHQKLFRLESVVPLFEADSPKTESFYSPWRKDSRPLIMVLHGCYVFTFVVHLWLRWGELRPAELSSTAAAHWTALKRSAEVLSGVQLLRQYARMTPLGGRLLDEIETTCRGLLEQVVVSEAVRAEINAGIEAQRQHHLGRSLCSDPITF
jgi:HEXXH motif-containing protein